MLSAVSTEVIPSHYTYDNNQQLTHKAAHPFLTSNLQCR